MLDAKEVGLMSHINMLKDTVFNYRVITHTWVLIKLATTINPRSFILP